MASPQLENGFTQIANELLERLSAACLSGKEMSVMFLLARLTYSAIKRRSVALPVSHIANYLEVDRSWASRLLKKMEKNKLITCTKVGKGRHASEYCIQKNWKIWNIQKRSPWPEVMGIKDTLEDIPLCCVQEATQTCSKSNTTETLCCVQEATQAVSPRNTTIQKLRPVADQNRPPRIGEGGKKKKTPQPPTGERRGVIDLSEKEIAEARNMLYKITGVFPEPKDFIRVRSVTRSVTPPDWAQQAWHHHCIKTTTDFLRKVSKRKRDGDDINCVYAVACALAKKQLLTDALHPEEFEGDYDESA